MREMKNSGIEWIGEIPKDWESRKIKYIATLNGRIGWQGLTSNEYCDDGAYLITGVNFNNGKIDWSTCVHVPMKRWEEASQIQIENGDLLITKDGTVGKVAIVSNMPAETSLNSGVLLIRTKDNCLKKFLFWVLQSDVFWKWFYTINSGNSTIIHLYQYDFCNFSFPFPKLDIQHRIAEYLDKKCSKIDEIISKQQQIIEKLKEYKLSIITEAVTKGLNPDVTMKDSGVEWIGEIPEHWEVVKIKIGVTKVGSGKTPSGGAEIYSDTGVLFLRSQNVYDTGIVLDNPTYITSEIDEEMKNTRVLPNDVLLNITGGSIGRCAIFPKELNNANVNQHVSIIRTKKDIFTSEYMHYYWISDLGQTAIKLYQTGGNREGMSADAIKNAPIALLPIQEQKQITDYLDSKCEKIDFTINKKQKLIDKLTEYKKSLIYEVVTGKKEV